MNIELLQKVKQAILDEPRKMDMNVWFDRFWADEEEKVRVLRLLGKEEAQLPPCGTIGCIAGWSVLLGSSMDPGELVHVGSTAARLLDLDFEQAYDLFHTTTWPSDLREKLSDSEPGTIEYAQVVAEAIDRYIAGDWEED